MSEETKIELATLFPKPFTALEFAHIANAPRFEVLKFVTGMAVSDPVGNLVAKLREVCEWLKVMRPQIPTASITAFFAGVIIAPENSLTPPFIFRLPATIKTALLRAVLPSVMVRAAGRVRNSSGGNFAAFVQAEFLPFAWPRPALQRSTHESLGFDCVLPALESRWHSLPVHSNLYDPAASSNRGQPISTRTVSLKRRSREPHLALGAFFESCRNTFSKLLNRDSGAICRNYLSTFFRLGHA